MRAYVRPAATVLALALNLGGTVAWLKAPPAGVAELRAMVLHDEARALQREGKYVEARHRFRFCAERYPDAVFGERAAYFAALSAMKEVGDLPGARAAFEAYAKRYPKGIFAERVREHLGFLATVPAEPPDAGVRYLRAENLISAGRIEEAEALLVDLGRRGISGPFAGKVEARARWARDALIGAKTR